MPPNSRSRYRFASATTDDADRRFLGFREAFDSDDRDDDKILRVGSGVDLMDLAWAGLDPTDLRRDEWWWILADKNQIHDPTRTLPVGSEIRAPSADVIRASFDETKRRG